MRIAFVVQRYGLEVNGGAELEARLIAEHVAPYVQVEVLTTCAVDYMTWKNEYTPGVETINGILVRRFPVRATRDVEKFNRFSADLLSRPHSYYDEIRWMALQGPDVPDLFAFVRERQDDYDLFLFFTYLYATTFLGLQIVPQKSILFPTAHDEPWIQFGIFQALFHLPRGFIFNSYEEDQLVRMNFRNEYIPGVVLGVGIEMPPIPTTDVLEEDYVLYLGRVDESKGCNELFSYFLRYKEQTGDPVKLVLIGSEAMPLPTHPDVISLGFMGEGRFAWLQKADLLVLPSPYESLSLATLEAFALGVPVLVNGAAPVLRGHCQRSHGGLYYQDETEFVESLRWLRSNEALRKKLGAQGRQYVKRHFRWPVVVASYVAFFRQIYEATCSEQEGGFGLTDLG